MYFEVNAWWEGGGWGGFVDGDLVLPNTALTLQGAFHRARGLVSSAAAVAEDDDSHYYSRVVEHVDILRVERDAEGHLSWTPVMVFSNRDCGTDVPQYPLRTLWRQGPT